MKSIIEIKKKIFINGANITCSMYYLPHLKLLRGLLRGLNYKKLNWVHF